MLAACRVDFVLYFCNRCWGKAVAEHKSTHERLRYGEFVLWRSLRITSKTSVFFADDNTPLLTAGLFSLLVICTAMRLVSNDMHGVVWRVFYVYGKYLLDLVNVSSSSQFVINYSVFVRF